MLRTLRRLPRMITARPLAESERANLIAILAEAGLPTDDTGAPGCDFFGFRDQRGDLVGYAGLAIHASNALLRSLVTPPEFRGRGYGRAITDRMMALALRRGVRQLYLLTTAAAPFFEQLGFQAIDRAEAPPTIAATAEFATLCPATATLMRRMLG